MVAELRALQLDLHCRSTFTKDGDVVQDTRSLIAELLPRPAPTQEQLETKAARSIRDMSRAFDDGFIEMG